MAIRTFAQVVIEFQSGDDSGKETYDNVTFREALTTFSTAHPHIGPIQVGMFGSLGGEERVTAGIAYIREIFRDLPYPPYKDAYKEMPEEDYFVPLYLPCPRCHYNTGADLKQRFSSKDIDCLLRVPKINYTCPGCGSSIGSWLTHTLNSRAELFNRIYGIDYRYWVRFARFHRNMVTFLFDLGDSPLMELLFLKYGIWMGSRLTVAEVAKLRGETIPHINDKSRRGEVALYHNPRFEAVDPSRTHGYSVLLEQVAAQFDERLESTLVDHQIRMAEGELPDYPAPVLTYAYHKPIDSIGLPPSIVRALYESGLFSHIYGPKDGISLLEVLKLYLSGKLARLDTLTTSDLKAIVKKLEELGIPLPDPTEPS